MDSGLGSISKLLSLAATLRNLHTKNITFVTMPTILDPANNDRLLPEEPEDDILWHLLQTDTTWHGQLPAVPASGVDVSVLNGTGITGLAARTAARLRRLGFHVTGIGDAPATSATTASIRSTLVGYWWSMAPRLTPASSAIRPVVVAP